MAENINLHAEAHRLIGYTVLKEEPPTDKPWAIVRIEVQFRESPGKASQYIYVVGHHDNYHIARYHATMLQEGSKTEEQVATTLESGGVG